MKSFFCLQVSYVFTRDLASIVGQITCMLCAVGHITRLLTCNFLGPPRIKLGCTSGENKVIVLAPGANAFWEHYVDSGRGFSYIVKSKCLKQRSVYYKCSGHCIPCTGYSFCSHTVAIAELEGNFETIIKWYEANKQRPATSQPFGRLIYQQGWAKNAKIHPGTQRGNQQQQ